MAHLTEAEVVRLWQRLRFEPQLTAEEGESIRVIYPGRPNDDRGGDFCQAVVAADQRLKQGNIEVHVKSGDWQAHNHHLDPAYNQVVLHVAMWAKTGVVTILSDGKTIPTLALHKYMESSGQSEPLACADATRRLSRPALGVYLDTAGEARFLSKVTEFQRTPGEKAAGQCLYEGIMAALGYAKNKRPFQQLAEGVSLRLLETVAKRAIVAEDYLADQQARLLGSAGLLPSQRSLCGQGTISGGWVKRLEQIWASWGLSQVLSVPDWHLFKVRPGNSPLRRLVAMSYLLLRYREPGLLTGLLNLVKEAASGRDRPHMATGLLVAADGYWADHIDFGLVSRRPAPALLGEGRAGDIIVNVLLPFACAWGQLAGPTELSQKALDLYRGYPRLAENAIERHMRTQIGLDNRLVNTARRQQGLLHIYYTLCTQGKCNSCRLGKPA